MRTSPARDAVRIARHPGLAALTLLQAPGPVLVDPAEKVLYFFVPVGSVARDSVPGIEIHSPAESLELPPLDRSMPPGPYWLTAAGLRGWVTADELVPALAAALAKGGVL